MTSSPQQPTSPREAALNALEVAFLELAREMRRRHAEASQLVHPGLSPASYGLLLMLRRTGALTLSEIAERMCADKGMTSRNLSELERHGLVERLPDPNDRRARLLNATEHGIQRLDMAHASYALRFEEILRDWPVDTIEGTTELLNALIQGAAAS